MYHKPAVSTIPTVGVTVMTTANGNEPLSMQRYPWYPSEHFYTDFIKLNGFGERNIFYFVSFFKPIFKISFIIWTLSKNWKREYVSIAVIMRHRIKNLVCYRWSCPTKKWRINSLKIVWKKLKTNSKIAKKNSIQIKDFIVHLLGFKRIFL